MKASPTAARAQGVQRGCLALIQDYGVLFAFVLVFGASAVWQPDYFLRPENLRNLLSQNAHIGIIAIGMTIVIIAGGIDLSVGSMVAFLGAVAMLATNKLISGGTPDAGAIWAAVAIALSLGCAAGLINGLLVTFGRIAPFVATLAGLSAYRSLALVLGDGGEIRSLSSALPGFA
ncbi:MAG TPA: ABC transporter permease, partial [Fimbriimonadaceae bacterium]|nr:ABC transporter permease [Fimbriimonadaceae bacterium]